MRKTYEVSNPVGKGGNGIRVKSGRVRDRASDSDQLLETFSREYGGRLLSFARRLCGDIDEAKELVQETFYRVLRAWDRYDPSQPLDAWSFTILRRVFFDTRKRYECKHTASLDAPVNGEDSSSLGALIPDVNGCFLEHLERNETGSLVQIALSRLNDSHRAVLTLCDMDGLTYREAAEVLDIPEGTVRSRISRARQSFRRRARTVQGLACVAEGLR